MKNRNITLLFVAVIFILACNLPAVTAPGSVPTPTFTPIILIAVNTPLPTTAPESTVPFASPSGDPLNCRSGPSTSYPAVAVLSPGQVTEIVGKNPEATWWEVKNLAAPGSFCWISMSFSKTTGDLSGVLVVTIPATLTPVPGATSAAGAVNFVQVSIEPDAIGVPGCIGPIQPVKLFGKIGTSGAAKIKWHFKDEQTGNLSSHDLNFKKADIQDVSDSFTPPLNAGKWRISLVVEGVDVSGLNNSAFYKITC